MIRKLHTAIKNYNLLPAGSSILAAVSGGADSVGLLHALCQLAPRLDIQLNVAHLNHQLRGQAATKDAQFVEKLARQLGLPFFGASLNIRRRASRKGLSFEMAAREARYEFFARTARKASAQIVATAHTADDQAETVLLKLARGAGRPGLSGIARDTMLCGLRVVRPMLDITKPEIIAFLKAKNLSWREDASNTDLSFLRNRVRHEIIPALESRLNPSVKEALLRTAEVLSEEDRLLEELTGNVLAECMRNETIPMSLDLDTLATLPLAICRRVLRRWLILADVPPEFIDFDAIARVIESMRRKRTGKQIEIGGGWIVETRYGALVIAQNKSRTTCKPFRVALKIPGETVLTEPGLRVITHIKPGIVKPEPASAGTLPAHASISRPSVGRRKIFIRTPCRGDRIKPLGLNGSKKLQDILVNDKVATHKRNSIPVFECAGEIIWLPGYRVARGWEVPDQTRPAIQLSVEKI